MATNHPPPPPPNPNSQSYHHHHFLPPPPPPPPPDLSTALSNLRHLLRLAHTSLSLFPTPNPSPQNTNLPLSVSSYLRYPHTLHSAKKAFNQTYLHDPNADLRFSYDEYGDFGPSFFYQDCPGSVSSFDHEAFTRTFTLPGILSIECTNFLGGDNDKVIKMGSFVQENKIRFLPSELWFIRSETEGWNDYPTSYSFNILRAIVSSLVIYESEFPGWVIANSPRHGIVIDEPMRDHIVLLFQLCLKAIVREAVNWAELVLIKDKKKHNPVAMSFNCSILFGVMKWLSSQLSVLYNEVNGKSFAMNMLKHWILDSSKSLSLFMVQNVHVSTVLNDTEGESVEQLKKSVDEKKDSVMDKSVNWETIFVSQVSAAVAALHERALLEEKLKMLRDAKQIPNYQRVAEHAYISNRADEERKRRTNYHPLLEHDGIILQRPNDQEGNTTKTREELLAEQRDYKRRRVSYRGKKLKRNATEVMRDIIEDYMNSIRQAGGIGCLAKVSDEAGKLFFEPSPSYFGGSKKDTSNSSPVTSDHLNGRKEQFQSHDDSRYTRFKDKDKPLDSNQYSRSLEGERSDDSRDRDDKEHSRTKHHRVSGYGDNSSGETINYQRERDNRDSIRYYEHRKDRRTTDRDRHSRDYYSCSLERKRSHDSKDRDDKEHSRPKHHRVSGYGDNSSGEKINYQRERDNRDLEDKDRRRKYLKRDHRADSVTSHVIEDRYDPYRSRDMYEE